MNESRSLVARHLLGICGNGHMVMIEKSNHRAFIDRGLRANVR